MVTLKNQMIDGNQIYLPLIISEPTINCIFLTMVRNLK